MGNILRLLLQRAEDHRNNTDVFVDFENCQPSPDEYDLWLAIQKKLVRAPNILDIVRNYPGAANPIKFAIEHSTNEMAQINAITALIPLVEQLRQCYEFAVELAETVPQLLSSLCTDELTTVVEHLESQQAVFKQFAEILEFILEFDNLKMSKPSIQNDFSFYRRICHRRRDLTDSIHLISTSNASYAFEPLSDEYTSKMSLFYAEATPMLKLVSRYTSQWSESERKLPVEVTTECLAAMAHICRGLLSNPNLRARFTRSDTTLLCLRVMTGVILLYDHIDPDGVFRKSSKLDVRSCVRILREQKGEMVKCLLNAIRYSTLHFNNDATPKSTKQLLSTS